MAVTTQNKNYSWYRYVDDSGRNWAVRAETDWGANANSGLAAFVSTDPPFGRSSRRRHPRMVQYIDPGSFRTFRGIFGTSAAYTAAPSTLTRPMYGASTGVVFNIANKIPERMPSPRAARQAGQDSLAA